MTSTAQQVWKAIDEDVVARRALEAGIASQKNLAVYLIKRRRLEAGADAVISAIRRYKEERPLEKTDERARKVIAKSKDVKITTNIVQVVLARSHDAQALLQKAFDAVDYEKGELLLVMQGEQTLKLLINEKNLERMLSIFSKRTVLEVHKELAQINIHLSDEAVRTPGIISLLSTELMMHGINVVEMMSCVPEMLFFVQQKDVVKSYEVLFGLCNG
jgi:aspartokinase